jgi:hypothetical protein
VTGSVGLDLIAAQIRKLPPRIQSVMQNEPYQLRRMIDLLNGGTGYTRNAGKYVESAITQLAAELARITVAPASDGETP